MIHPVQLKKTKKMATLVAVFGLSLAVAGCGAPSQSVTPIAPIETSPVESVPTPQPQPELAPPSAPTSTPVPSASAPAAKPVTKPVENKPALQPQATTPTPTPAPAPTSSVPAPTASPAEVKKPTPASVYKDGTYSATGNYGSPGGAEEIGVTITLNNDVIAEANVQVRATIPRSKIMQDDFAANYKPFVIGKKIDEVHLTKVSGSSLTPGGFNDAIAKIKAQAK